MGDILVVGRSFVHFIGNSKQIAPHYFDNDLFRSPAFGDALSILYFVDTVKE